MEMEPFRKPHRCEDLKEREDFEEPTEEKETRETKENPPLPVWHVQSVFFRVALPFHVPARAEQSLESSVRVALPQILELVVTPQEPGVVLCVDKPQ